MQLEGKVALVTGASRGIGQAIAEQLSTAGARVVGTATTAQGAEFVAKRLAERGGTGMVLNVASGESVAQVVEAVQSDFGPVAILVNNAGITRDNLLMRMKPDDWDAVIDTNLTSLYRMTKACLRGMSKARWGRVVNIGSVVGAMGNAGQTNYAAAKAGLGGFTRALAREVGGRGVTVNAVAPGFIETDMTRALDEGQREQMLAQIPAGRFGQPAEIAAVVAFLCSPDGGYVNGETLHVNGGMYMA
ncbi:MAG: 3-oxoacyl-ACP reductase FabG [Pseudomonadota bacterium]|nr:3-oxoacyl-ACP reductase FabG [Pseudomonadota bacterium]